MKLLYFDCANGISGDMLLKAVSSLSGEAERIYETADNEMLSAGAAHHHDHGHDHEHGRAHEHGRSFAAVREMIGNSGFSEAAKATALKIYGHIAAAEAKVHGATLETVHFHEVGRDEAIKNALAIGMAIELINPDKILVSDICDGHGTVICSHGEISVPVPAVMALRENCRYAFRTVDVETEMVTPSGLAGLMGIGAEPAADDILKKAETIAKTEARGSRQTGRPGLMAYILEV